MSAQKLKAEIPTATNLHEDLLTQDELAARLKVTTRSVMRLQHDGVIPFILLGKSVRFFWPSVVSHLNANSTVVRVAAPPAIRPHGQSKTIFRRNAEKDRRDACATNNETAKSKV